jgi:N utilization substance protein B
MKDADRGQAATIEGEGLRIGIVRARFNDAITGVLAEACVGELRALGVAAADIRQLQVPGALEIPVALKALAETEDYDALIALGCIIRGETYHFELVANESGAGVTRVALDHLLPVANAILTVENEAQAWARAALVGRARGGGNGQPDGRHRVSSAPPAKAAAARRPAAKSARRRAREAALQGLYQWLLSRADGTEIEAHLQEQDEDGFARLDRVHFDALLHGCIREAAAIDTLLARHVDRKTSLLSPVEHAVLMIGVYELQHCVDIPYRVALNESVELAKAFGGTDGHKYVNGVLDKAAAELRPAEVAAARAARRE